MLYDIRLCITGNRLVTRRNQTIFTVGGERTMELFIKSITLIIICIVAAQCIESIVKTIAWMYAAKYSPNILAREDDTGDENPNILL